MVPSPNLCHSLSHLNTMLEPLVDLVEVVIAAQSGSRL